MMLTPEQKEEVIGLIEIGDQLKAIRYLKEMLFISTDQALTLAEKIEAELKAPVPDEEGNLPSSADPHSGMNVGKVVGGIFMIVGFIQFAVAGYLIYSHQKFEQRAEPVQGKVVSYESYESRNNNSSSYTTMYTPIFEYSFRGQLHKYKSSTSSSSQEYQINEMVEVLVDPEDPESPLINTFWENWFLPLLLGIMGIFFGGLGFVSYWFLGKRN